MLRKKKQEQPKKDGWRTTLCAKRERESRLNRSAPLAVVVPISPKPIGTYLYIYTYVRSVRDKDVR
jgi:hypothetical protein